jgi:hypothetical protein
MQAFSLRYDEEEIRNYRRIADKNEGPKTQPAELNRIRWYSTVLLYSEFVFQNYRKQRILNSYECGKMMDQMNDYWLSQLLTPSNEHDSSLIQSQNGNIRMRTCMRMLDREILIKWGMQLVFELLATTNKLNIQRRKFVLCHIG